MDKIVSKIVALGVPGLVLLIAIHLTGLAGGAAIVAALAALGGPLGMMGGLVLLGILVLISNAIAKYGFEKIMGAVVKGWVEEGKMTKQEILKKVLSYPISRDLKDRIKRILDQYFDEGAG